MLRKHLIKELKNNDENISDMIMDYLYEECNLCKKSFNKLLTEQDKKYICETCDNYLTIRYIVNYLLKCIHKIFWITLISLILLSIFLPLAIIPIFILYFIAQILIYCTMLEI